MNQFVPLALDRAPADTRRILAADRIALDRSPSSRSFDAGGHLEIADNILSAAGVSEYRGAEIPGWDALGLDPGRLYRMLRPPAALAQAAASFNGKPLLSRHRPQYAADHDPDVVVGAVSNVRFVPPYLRGTLTVWQAGAIGGIADNTMRDLSCGYFYRPKMTPGVYGSTSYDGVMTEVSGNHVTLCDRPRVPGSMVGDAAPAFRPPSAAWQHALDAAHRVDLARRYPGAATLKNNRP